VWLIKFKTYDFKSFIRSDLVYSCLCVILKSFRYLAAAIVINLTARHFLFSRTFEERRRGWKAKNYYPLANEVAKGYSNTTVRPSFRPSFHPSVRPSVLPWHPCEHSRINILQWILTKLGTWLALKRIWNPFDLPGHRSQVKVTGSNFYPVTSLWTL
jgi:hypothetical protein